MVTPARLEELLLGNIVKKPDIYLKHALFFARNLISFFKKKGNVLYFYSYV